jgi:DUF1365 family protein
MKGRVLRGEVWHRRNIGPANAFRYKVLYTEVELGSLDNGLSKPWLLGINRFNLYSLNDQDHYCDEQGGFATAIPRLMNGGIAEPGLRRIRMITQPSMIGYVFNPVTFYLGENGNARTTLVVAEVHNRVGKRHEYVLQPRLSAGALTAEFEKDFYVSPFVEKTGQYRFSFEEHGNDLELGLDLFREGECLFETRLALTAKPLTNVELAKALVTYPLTPQRTVAAIYWQALKLTAKGARHRGASDT